MKSGKRHRTDGMELPNHDKIKTLGENETYKYLGILEADTIKQVQMKDGSEKNISGEIENYSRQNSPAETSSKQKIARYSGPFLKWTRDELKQMDQKSRKLMTMHKVTLTETTLTDYMYLEKREEENLPASKTALTHRYNGSKTT